MDIDTLIDDDLFVFEYIGSELHPCTVVDEAFSLSNQENVCLFKYLCLLFIEFKSSLLPVTSMTPDGSGRKKKSGYQHEPLALNTECREPCKN